MTAIPGDRSLLPALLMAVAMSGAAQPQMPSKTAASAANTGPVIRISSNLVPVPVSVTDEAGRLVRGLAVEQFQVEEDGERQQVITLGDTEQTSIELALLIDVSASVRGRFQLEKDAAGKFLRSLLRPGDTVSIFSIGRALGLVQERTSNIERAAASVTGMQATSEPTAFFDSIVEATRYLRGSPGSGSRRVLVVLSDGEDTHSSRHNLGDAVQEMRQADCLFYSINPSVPSISLNKISLKGQETLKSLALETGGAFAVETSEALEPVFQQIAEELRGQYLLGYYSNKEGCDGSFRQIRVSVLGRPELHVRARRGYFARKNSQSPG